MGRILKIGSFTMAWLGVSWVAGGETIWPVLEPAFQRPPFHEQVAGAEETIIAVAQPDEHWGLRFVEKMDGNTLDELLLGPSEQVEALFQDQEILYYRDDDDILEYAAITDENHLLTAIVFAQGFYDQFSDLFGPEFLVVIPNRFTLYIFPKLAGTVELYGPIFLDQYSGATYPVSREVLERSAEGLRAVGSFAPGADPVPDEASEAPSR